MDQVPNVFGTQSGKVSAAELDQNFNFLLPITGWPANTVLGNPTGGTGPVIAITASQLYTMLKGALPWECAGFMGGVQGAGNWQILRYQPSTNVIINQGNCLASCGTVATVSAVFNIADNGTVIGTVTFSPASATGTVALNTSPYTVTQGHVITVVAPLTPDTTLADVNVTLGGTRG